MSDRIVVGKGELFAKGVDEALARDRSLRGNPPREPEEIPAWRRLLLSSAFYLPAAGALAAFIVWIAVEPGFNDTTLIAGQVELVDTSPLPNGGFRGAGPVARYTVGPRAFTAFLDHTVLENAVDGRPAFESFDALQPGVAIEASCLVAEGGELLAVAIRPLEQSRVGEAPAMPSSESTLLHVLLFPMTAVAIAAALFAAEGAASRNWVRTAERGLAGVGLTLVFSFVAFVPAGLLLSLGKLALKVPPGHAFVTTNTISGPALVAFAACRSAAWASIGAALGLGMNLVRSTKVELRNSVVGGTLGGALGGIFFDPVSRFCTSHSLFMSAAPSRAIGLVAVGLSVGWFVALVDQLAREAWLRVRTGPLAGKSFVIHRTPITLGSSPRCDIYLFKDAEIDGEHAKIHKVGNRFEIEDAGSRAGTTVGGVRVRRHRLQSGDRIVLGGTVLEFEERSRATAAGGER